MSRSIKQYKNAMDKIKVSDNFAGRTENLMKEFSQKENIPIETVQNKKRFINRITAAAGLGFAACIAAVFAFKGIFFSNASGASADEAADMIDDIMVEDEVDSADDYMEELVTELEFEDDIFDDFDEDIFDDSDSGGVAYDPAADSIEKDGLTEDAATVAEPPPSDSYDSAVNYSASADGAAENSAFMIDTAVSALEIIPYVEINGSVPEALSPEKSAALDIMKKYNEIVTNSNSYESVSDFDTEFAAVITESKTGYNNITFYLMKNNVLTADLITSEGIKRTSYIVSESDYEELEKMMYCCFGTGSDYEAFAALKSGK